MIIKVKRLIAMVIDYYIIFYPCWYLLNFIAFLTGDNLVFQFALSLFGFILVCGLFAVKDIIFGYESIGKKIVKLKIYDETGNRLTNKKKLFKRVIYTSLLIPFYIFMILINNKSLGDIIMHTSVK